MVKAMKKVINEIINNDNFVVLAHVNPDGDAIGSSIALYLYLKGIGKNVDVVIPNMPKKYCYLEGYNDILSSSDKVYDVGIILDTATYERINFDKLDNIKRLVVVDHHVSNTLYGDVNYIEGDAPSCGNILYKILEGMSANIDKGIGEALYSAIVSDTGGFRNNTVNSETFLIASKLSNIVDVSYIYRKVIGTITDSQFELRKKAINNLEFYFDKKVAYTYITKDELECTLATKDECSGLVNIARDIDGVEISIFARIIDNEVKISLRSNYVDVNLIANKFGGGGHKCAAGITLLDVDSNDIKDKLLKEVEKSIYEWINSSK